MQQRSQFFFVRIRQFLPLAILPVLTGCLFTGPMWRDANEGVVTEPRAVGIIGGEAGANGTERRLLVIEYSINEGERLYATIPLSRDGCPVEPFIYTGDERRPVGIVEALPDAQRRHLAETKLAMHGEQWAVILEGDPRFRRLNWNTDGTSVPHDANYGGEVRGSGNCGRRADIRVRAIRVGRPWSKAEAAAMPLPVGSPIEYPQDACVLILPYAQRRPEGHRHDAQWRAALLTPVTIVGDAVVVPLIYIACYGFGQCP
jgi:hypothetical protein